MTEDDSWKRPSKNEQQSKMTKYGVNDKTRRIYGPKAYAYWKCWSSWPTK